MSLQLVKMTSLLLFFIGYKSPGTIVATKPIYTTFSPNLVPTVALCTSITEGSWLSTSILTGLFELKVAALGLGVPGFTGRVAA